MEEDALRDTEQQTTTPQAVAIAALMDVCRDDLADPEIRVDAARLLLNR